MPWRSHSRRQRYAHLTRRDLLELLIAQEKDRIRYSQYSQGTAEAPHNVRANDGVRAMSANRSAAAEMPRGKRFATKGAVRSDGGAKIATPPPASFEDIERPSLEELYTQLEREKTATTFTHILRNTVGVLVTVAAVAVLVATLLMPVLQITGNSMTPTVSEGQYVVSLKGTSPAMGDIIAFYYNNNILVKRVIAGPGDWVNIDEYGNVSVNDEPLDEPYVYEKALGECDIDLPYQVPDGRYFVMGDHRSTSVDSRSSTIGCVAEEQIVGTIVFRVWPLNEFGPLA